MVTMIVHTASAMGRTMNKSHPRSSGVSRILVLYKHFCPAIGPGAV